MIFVGIDVAKDKHDCCILDEFKTVLSYFTFANDKPGFEKLLSEIKRFSSKKDFSDAKIGLESTGHYSTNITNFLLQKRLTLQIYNPLQVSLLRKAESLRKTKTDKSDCKFIAIMLMSDNSKPIQSVCPFSELKTLTRNRKRLISARSKMKVSVSRLVTIVFPELPSVVYSINQKSIYALLSEFSTAKEISKANLIRLTNLLLDNSGGKYGREKAIEIRNLARNSIGFDSCAMGFEVRQTIRLIENLQSEIDILEKEIKKLMNDIDSPILTIPGIGFVLGSIILSEYGDINNFGNPNQMLKFAGMEPSVYESGKFKATKTSMVKRGSPYLRWALFQAARLVSYRDETFCEYADKKFHEGKHFLVVQSHVAKKLIHIIFHLLKNNEKFALAH